MRDVIKSYKYDVSTESLLSAEEELKLAINIRKMGLEFVSYVLSVPYVINSLKDLSGVHDKKDQNENNAIKLLLAAADYLENGKNIPNDLVIGIFNATCETSVGRYWLRDFQLNLYQESIDNHKLKTYNDIVTKKYLDLSTEKNKLASANLRLVISVAKRYTLASKWLSFEDLIQEGNIGLMRAVDKFNPDLGNRFTTYAILWIKQSIRRALSDKDKAIRLPVHIFENIFKLNNKLIIIINKINI